MVLPPLPPVPLKIQECFRHAIRDSLAVRMEGKPKKSLVDLQEYLFANNGDEMAGQFFQYKWTKAPEMIEHYFTLWKEVKAYKMTYPTGSLQTLVDPDLAPVLCVDACPTQGAGYFYCPRTKTCLTYKVNFKTDLGVIAERTDPSTFEMLNLLFSLFLFKQKLMSYKVLKLLTDNTKVSSKKDSTLVATIHRILTWLEIQTDLTIVNDPNRDFNLVRRKRDNWVFLKFADYLSKDKDFKLIGLREFAGVDFCQVGKAVIGKYKGYF